MFSIPNGNHILLSDFNKGRLMRFFCNVGTNLKITPNESFETVIENEKENLVQNAINRIKNHLSMKIINLGQVKSLDTENTYLKTFDKTNVQVLFKFLPQNIIQYIKISRFPYDLKLGDLIVGYKIKLKISKDNYRPRPISIFPNILKIQKRCIYNYMKLYADNILSRYQ